MIVDVVEFFNSRRIFSSARPSDSLAHHRAAIQRPVTPASLPRPATFARARADGAADVCISHLWGIYWAASDTPRIPSQLHHRQFKRDLGSLLEVFRFIDDFITSHDIAPSVTQHVRLAVDELFTNLVRFQPGSSEEMSISMDAEGDRVIVRMTTQGVEPFDITQVPEPDFDAPLERRDERGLGVYLCRKVMDDVRYEYENQGRTSTVTLVKKFER